MPGASTAGNSVGPPSAAGGARDSPGPGQWVLEVGVLGVGTALVSPLPRHPRPPGVVFQVVPLPSPPTKGQGESCALPPGGCWTCLAAQGSHGLRGCALPVLRGGAVAARWLGPGAAPAGSQRRQASGEPSSGCRREETGGGGRRRGRRGAGRGPRRGRGAPSPPRVWTPRRRPRPCPFPQPRARGSEGPASGVLESWEGCSREWEAQCAWEQGCFAVRPRAPRGPLSWTAGLRLSREAR